MEEHSGFEHIPVKNQQREIRLEHSLGTARAASVVQDIICTYERIFPQRIAGYYVEGS